MPEKMYDVTVIAIRIDAGQFCEAADEGLHALAMKSTGGNNDMRFEYRVVVMKRQAARAL